MDRGKVSGQTRLIELLQRAIAHDRLAHAYLFWGPEGIGKWALAIELAKVVNCEKRRAEPCGICPACRKIDALSHPDLELLYPLPKSRKSRSDDEEDDADEESRLFFLSEKRKNPYRIVRFERYKTITMARIRETQSRLALKPFEARKRVLIVADAETLRSDCANILLKTIEEPPPETLVILTTQNPSLLLPTIVSRCQLLRLSPVPDSTITSFLKEQTDADQESVSRAVALAGGSPGKALEFLDPEIQNLLNQAKAVWSEVSHSEMAALVGLRALVYQLPRDRIFLLLDFWANQICAAWAESFDTPQAARQTALPLVSAQKILSDLEQIRAHLWVNVNASLALGAFLLRAGKLLRSAPATASAASS